ncbi:MAG: hypothetical protein AAGA48_39745 [Myxococcota bacterium]
MGILSMVGWLALTGCGTETGNPEAEASLLYNARSKVPEVISLEPDSAGTSVSSVWLRLEAVTLSANCDADDDDAFAFDPLGLADHAGKEAVVQDVLVPNDVYCGLTTALIPGEDGPGRTAGASVVVEGLLTDGRAFAVVLDDTFDLTLDLDAEAPPEEGGWLLSFDVGTWIEPSELIGLQGDPVVVSSNENADVLAAISARIADGVQLHHDVNANGLIEAEEPRLDLP